MVNLMSASCLDPFTLKDDSINSSGQFFVSTAVFSFLEDNVFSINPGNTSCRRTGDAAPAHSVTFNLTELSGRIIYQISSGYNYSLMQGQKHIKSGFWHMCHPADI